jgi:serine/threonine protein kinase/tetratricopeptide (TPR) repeat protein
MQGERWRRIEELCYAALERDQSKRRVFLHEACGSDEDLRLEVESILAWERNAREFMETPPLQLGAWLLAEDEAEDKDKVARPSDDLGLIGSTVSHYRIVEELGAGGMGVVYKAEDTKLGRFVALKFLSRAAANAGSGSSPLPTDPGQASEALERFEREARACCVLDHPNICTIYEVDQHEGLPFIAMQFLVGCTLKQEIGGQPLPLAQILDFGVQIANGLDAAQTAGIIHRDIKPANIFVTQHGEVKILDFGLAKLAPPAQVAAETLEETAPRQSADVPQFDATIAERSRTFGTLAYMSPEQAGGQLLDARTDLFSCGVVLYEMATGQLPFQGDTPIETFDKLLHTTPVPPSKVIRGGSPALDRVIARALEKDRDHRYTTAEELRADLTSLRDDSAAIEIKKSYARQRNKRNWISASVLALLVAAAGYTYQHPGQTHRLTEQDTIVLSDLANHTGEPIFDQTLKQALRMQLEQSPFLNVLSDQKMSEELGYMGRPRDTRLTDQVTREVCLRTGSKAMLTGSISTLGTHYIVGIAATGCHSGDSLATEQAEAANREGVLRALGQAGTRMRAKLGESLASIQKYDAPLEQVTTTSLEALHAYGLGIGARFAEGNDPSIPFFKRATELDPNFAMAYARLGSAYFDLDQTTLARAATGRAYELRDRVTEREKFYIESHYYDTVTGQYDKAIQVYQVWKQTYPHDQIPVANLGDIYSYLGQHEQALTEETEAVRLAPGNAAIYVNLINAYASLNQTDKARKLLLEAEVSKPDNAMFRILSYQLAFLRGDSEEMQRQVAGAMGQPGLEGEMLALQADTEAYNGRLTKAREFTRRAIESALRNSDMETASGYRVMAALREAELGNRLQARGEVAAALASGSGQVVEVLGALALARAGLPNSAFAIAKNLNRQFPVDTLLNGYWLPTIRAAAETDSGRPAAAIGLSQIASPYELGEPRAPTNCVLYPIYIRGLAYLADGQGSQAVAEFQKILSHRGLVGNFPLGSLAYLQLGRAYALAGNAAKARGAYESFLSLWANADSDIPVLKAAKLEYAKL